MRACGGWPRPDSALARARGAAPVGGVWHGHGVDQAADRGMLWIAEFLLQGAQQIQHPGLHADIQRADAFVGDDEVGLQGQRPGIADPLALTPRKFVRIAVKLIAGRRGRRCPGSPGVPRSGRRPSCAGQGRPSDPETSSGCGGARGRILGVWLLSTVGLHAHRPWTSADLGYVFAVLTVVLFLFKLRCAGERAGRPARPWSTTWQPVRRVPLTRQRLCRMSRSSSGC